jgi:glycosyltransferase involved in cell wall biosynthesis
VTWIYNGYDPDDFPVSAPQPRGDGRYRLAYVGTLWNLTNVEPLVKAVRLLAERRPELASRLELVFAGRRTPQQQEYLQSLRGTPCQVVEHAYLDHRDAVELMNSADGLCILLADVPGAERVVPAKVFESMATRRPILAIAPRGELWELLGDYPGGKALEPKDLEGIFRELVERIEASEREAPAPFAEWDAGRYDRREQARQLAELLTSLVESKSPAMYEPASC